MAQPPNNCSISVALTGSDQAAVTGDGVFFGGVFYESGGSNAATAKIHDGTSASGTIIGYISVASSGLSNVNIANGVRFTTGIYVDVAGSGTIAGSIFYTT